MNAEAGPFVRDPLVDLACRIQASRSARTRFFSRSLLGEPSWDMLLSLFCLPPHSEKLSISRLSESAGLPQTTGLRWTRVMEQKGLIVRSPDPYDQRRFYLSLTEKGEQLMRDYLSAIQDQV